MKLVTATALLSAALFSSASLAQDGDPLAAARAKLKAGEFLEAAELLEPITQEDPENGAAWYLLGSALHHAKEIETALGIHERAAEFDQVRASASYNAACACALLGDKEGAFHWLGTAMEAGFKNLNHMMSDPDLASLRRDARFQALLPIGTPATFLEDVKVHYTLEGEAAGDRFGWIGRNAGDCDGDGIADLLISAPFKVLGANPQAAEGRIYVYSGATGKELFRRDGGPNFYLGIGIESAGDVNGDGRADVLAGANGAYGTGAALIYSGKDGSLLRELRGEAQGDNFGRKVAGAGDQDGDGYDDIIVGANNFDGPAGVDAGRAYVFSGKTGEALWVLDGEAGGDYFGNAVDGYARGKDRILVVGAPAAGKEKRGRVYVYRVGDDGPKLAFKIESSPGDQNLGRMFVSAVGDVNGDGWVDVYASDWESSANGIGGSGRIYVHSGKDGQRLHELAGQFQGDGFGIGTAEAGDVDKDGCDDLLIGAWQNDEGAQGGGKCYLYSGKTQALLATYTCSTWGDTFGYDTTGLGDIDGDGVLDFLITSADSYVRGRQSGRVLVVSQR